MPTTTDSATHVYLKRDNPKGLLQSYTGPHEIVERPSHSTIKVKVGTFRSGVENIQLHHWANAKPAVVRADTKLAQMPVRGRPPKNPKPTTDPEDTDDSSEAAKPALPNQRAKNKQPTRRSERIKAKTHATSITTRPRLTPPPGYGIAGKFKPPFD